MTDKHGDVMYRAHYGPPEGRAAARAELARINDQRQRQDRQREQEREHEEGADRARRLLNVPDQKPDASHPEGTSRTSGDAMYEYHYGTGRRWTGFGATE